MQNDQRSDTNMRTTRRQNTMAAALVGVLAASLYSSLEPWFDKMWKPEKIER